MQPTFRRFAATMGHPPRAPIATPFAARMLFPMVVIGCVGGVVGYIRSQLSYESNAMNSIFAQKNDEKHEAARKKIYTEREPRNSMYNVLSWQSS